MAQVGSRRTRWGALSGIAMVVALAVAGCASGSATPGESEVAPAPVTAGPGGADTGGPTPTVDSIVISSSAPDNSWSVTFKKPLVSGVSDALATTINDAISAKVNGYIQDFTEGKRPEVTSGSPPSTLEGDFTIALTSPSIVSFRFTLVTHVSGGAPLVFDGGSISIWVYTGATISLTDIFTDQKAALPKLSSQAHAALAASLGKSLTWSGSATSISFFDNWAITKAGLEFTWAQGKIAGSEAGSPSVTLPWSSIKSLIKTSGPAGQFVR